MKYLSYGRQSIDAHDIREVIKVLRSDWLTQGPKIKEFENALAEYCGVNYAVVVSSGTAALHLAALASGLKKGDEAITSPITFLATPNSVVYTGARPVFADINYDTINIDPDQIKRKITKKTKVILPVHFAGLPCDMEKIHGIAKKNNLMVIEDAAHSLGAEYRVNGRWFKVGSCKHSDMTIFSFHPVKHITTGEGGAITTNSKKFYEKLRLLRSHGIYKDKNIAKNRPWYYEMRDLGFNYRITDFQAALGISQIKKLDYFIKERRKIVEKYNRIFKNKEFLTVPVEKKNVYSSFHLYILLIDFKKIGKTRSEVIEKLRVKKIGVQVHYIPVHLQPYYRKNFGFNWGDYPVAENYYEKTLSIPLYPKMSNRQVKYVIKNIINLVSR